MNLPKSLSMAVVVLGLLSAPGIGVRAADASPTLSSAQSHNAQALAEARIGRWSRALAELRLAERQAPFDAIVQENLRLVRSKLDQPSAPNPLATLGRLPVNLWAGLTLGAAWLLAGISAARRLAPAREAGLRRARVAVAATAAVAATLLGLTLLGRRLTPDAVVIAKDAILRQGPVDAAKPVGTIADGSEVRVRREHRGWLEVGPIRPGSPAQGWLPPGHAIVVAP